MTDLNLPCPDCGRIGVCVCDDKAVELRALRATIAEQAAKIASLRDRERTIREAINLYLSEQTTSKRKLTDALLAHLPELHGGDSEY